MENGTRVFEVYEAVGMDFRSVGLFFKEDAAKAVTVELNETKYKETFDHDDYELITGAMYVEREVF